jgi:hypothetical protein
MATCDLCNDLKRAYAVAALNWGELPKLYEGKPKNLSYMKMHESLKAEDERSRRAYLEHMESAHGGKFMGDI